MTAEQEPRALLAELHTAMADVMEMRRSSSSRSERAKVRAAVDVWRRANDYLRRDAEPPEMSLAVVYGFEAGVEHERAQVARWLRQAGNTMRQVALAIERGDHRGGGSDG